MYLSLQYLSKTPPKTKSHHESTAIHRWKGLGLSFSTVYCWALNSLIVKSYVQYYYHLSAIDNRKTTKSLFKTGPKCEFDLFLQFLAPLVAPIVPAVLENPRVGICITFSSIVILAAKFVGYHDPEDSRPGWSSFSVTNR